jgi:hypothetical protein
MPAQYIDYIQGLSTHLAHMPPTNYQEHRRTLNQPIIKVQPEQPQAPDSPASEDIPHQPPLVPYRTAPDAMGLFRIYSACPTMIPKGDTGLDAAVNAPTLDRDPSIGSSQITTGLPSPEIGPDNLFSPFSSPTAGLLMCW